MGLGSYAAPWGSSRLEHYQWFFDVFESLLEANRIFYPLNIGSNNLGVGIGFKMFDQINFIYVGTIPKACKPGDTKFVLREPVEHGCSNRAALADNRNPPFAGQ